MSNRVSLYTSEFLVAGNVHNGALSASDGQFNPETKKISDFEHGHIGSLPSGALMAIITQEPSIQHKS